MKLFIWGSYFLLISSPGSLSGAQTHLGFSLLAPRAAWLWLLVCHSHQLCISNTFPFQLPCLLMCSRCPLGNGLLWACQLPLLYFLPLSEASLSHSDTELTARPHCENGPWEVLHWTLGAIWWEP